MQEEGTVQGDGREGALKLLFGRICCMVGLLLGAGGFVVAILGASVNVSAGAVGIALGVLGYFLGARRLGAASVVLGHCRCLLHGCRKHRPDPRGGAPGSRIRLARWVHA